MTSLPPSHIRRRHAQRGSSLLLVFWLLAMMGLFIYSADVIVKEDLDMTLSQKQAFRARQLAEMGINIAMNPVVKEYDFGLLNQGPEVADSVPLPLQIPMEEGESVEVKIKGEGGRININALLAYGRGQDPAEADKARKSFHFLLSAWGVPDDKGSENGHDAIWDRMVDWVDADDTSTGIHGGGEKEYYNPNDPDNSLHPFNHPFYKLDELPQVKGFDQIAAVVHDWRDYFTIYSGSMAVDPNEAEDKVIAAAMMMVGTSEPEPQDFAAARVDAQILLEKRAGGDKIEDTEDDEKLDQTKALDYLGLDAESGAFDTLKATDLIGGADQTVHIESTATVGEYRKRVVLIVRNRTGTPQILTREEVPLSEKK